MLNIDIIDIGEWNLKPLNCFKNVENPTNVKNCFRRVKEEQNFFDVTLACDGGHQIKAHKVILSAGSEVFNKDFLFMWILWSW